MSSKLEKSVLIEKEELAAPQSDDLLNPKVEATVEQPSAPESRIPFDQQKADKAQHFLEKNMPGFNRVETMLEAGNVEGARQQIEAYLNGEDEMKLYSAGYGEASAEEILQDMGYLDQDNQPIDPPTQQEAVQEPEKTIEQSEVPPENQDNSKEETNQKEVTTQEELKNKKPETVDEATGAASQTTQEESKEDHPMETETSQNQGTDTDGQTPEDSRDHMSAEETNLLYQDIYHEVTGDTPSGEIGFDTIEDALIKAYGDEKGAEYAERLDTSDNMKEEWESIKAEISQGPNDVAQDLSQEDVAKILEGMDSIYTDKHGISMKEHLVSKLSELKQDVEAGKLTPEQAREAFLNESASTLQDALDGKLPIDLTNDQKDQVLETIVGRTSFQQTAPTGQVDQTPAEILSKDQIDKEAKKAEHTQKYELWKTRYEERPRYIKDTFRAFADLMQTYHASKAGIEIKGHVPEKVDIFVGVLKFMNTSIVETLLISLIKEACDLWDDKHADHVEKEEVTIDFPGDMEKIIDYTELVAMKTEPPTSSGNIEKTEKISANSIGELEKHNVYNKDGELISQKITIDSKENGASWIEFSKNEISIHRFEKNSITIKIDANGVITGGSEKVMVDNKFQRYESLTPEIAKKVYDEFINEAKSVADKIQQSPENKTDIIDFPGDMGQIIDYTEKVKISSQQDTNGNVDKTETVFSESEGQVTKNSTYDKEGELQSQQISVSNPDNKKNVDRMDISKNEIRIRCFDKNEITINVDANGVITGGRERVSRDGVFLRTESISPEVAKKAYDEFINEAKIVADKIQQSPENKTDIVAVDNRDQNADVFLTKTEDKNRKIEITAKVSMTDGMFSVDAKMTETTFKDTGRANVSLEENGKDFATIYKDENGNIDHGVYSDGQRMDAQEASACLDDFKEDTLGLHDDSKDQIDDVANDYMDSLPYYDDYDYTEKDDVPMLPDAYDEGFDDTAYTEEDYIEDYNYIDDAQDGTADQDNDAVDNEIVLDDQYYDNLVDAYEDEMTPNAVATDDSEDQPKDEPDSREADVVLDDAYYDGLVEAYEDEMTTDSVSEAEQGSNETDQESAGSVADLESSGERVEETSGTDPEQGEVETKEELESTNEGRAVSVEEALNKGEEPKSEEKTERKEFSVKDKDDDTELNLQAFAEYLDPESNVTLEDVIPGIGIDSLKADVEIVDKYINAFSDAVENKTIQVSDAVASMPKEAIATITYLDVAGEWGQNLSDIVDDVSHEIDMDKIENIDADAVIRGMSVIDIESGLEIAVYGNEALENLEECKASLEVALDSEFTPEAIYEALSDNDHLHDVELTEEAKQIVAETGADHMPDEVPVDQEGLRPEEIPVEQGEQDLSDFEDDGDPFDR